MFSGNRLIAAGYNSIADDKILFYIRAGYYKIM
jgi:hypothetical protein